MSHIVSLGYLWSHTYAIFTACRTTRFFSPQTPVSTRACIGCCKEIIRSNIRFTFTTKAPGWFVIVPKVPNYMRTRIELLHKQTLHPTGIFSSLKSGGLLVSLASVSRSWIIKELQITGFVASLLCSGRPAKLSVHAKSIYRSTDAKKWWQTFLEKKFFFLQSLRKHEDRSAFK